MGSTAQGAAGQTVQSQQNGNNDSSTVYNTGGNNNANQCTWMHQKVDENTARATRAAEVPWARSAPLRFHDDHSGPRGFPRRSRPGPPQ